MSFQSTFEIDTRGRGMIDITAAVVQRVRTAKIACGIARTRGPFAARSSVELVQQGAEAYSAWNLSSTLRDEPRT